MSTNPLPNLSIPHRPSTKSAVGHNILVARTSLGWSQQRLATTSGVSRATIMQLEAGLCDPRLSTIELLARALFISPSLLLFSDLDFRALAHLPHPKPPSPAQKRAYEALDFAFNSRHFRSRLEAADRGVNIASQSGLTTSAHLVGAAIGSAQSASRATLLGAHLAHLIHHFQSNPSGPPPDSPTEESSVAANI